MIKDESNKIQALLGQVEVAFGRKMKSPRDFEWLSTELNARQGVQVSTTTLKRLWGYLTSTTSPRRFTLDSLARAVGYRDYDHFVHKGQGSGLDESPSDVVLSKRLNVARDLAVRDRVLLSWHPGRECVVRYLDRNQFVVEQSTNTRLLPGNTFDCGLMIEDEPLYIDNLVQQDGMPKGYVCGKVGGIHFEVIKAESSTMIADED